MTRNVWLTVRLPGASTAPATSTRTWFQTGAVKQSRKADSQTVRTCGVRFASLAADLIRVRGVDIAFVESNHVRAARVPVHSRQSADGVAHERAIMGGDRRHPAAHRALPLSPRRRHRRASQPRLHAPPRPVRCPRGKAPAHWTQRQRRGPLLVSLAGAMGCYWAVRAHHPTHRRGPPLHRGGGYLLGAVLTRPSLKKRKVELRGCSETASI